jgi:lysophospholipase L1-like esterase
MNSISPSSLRRARLRARRAWIVFAVCAALAVTDIASAQRATRGAAAREHWVASWATAQLLVPMNLGRPGGPPPGAPAGAPGAATAPPAAPAAPRPTPPPPIVPAPPIPTSFADQTIRMVVRTSLGGQRVRIALSQTLNAEPLEVGAAHIAIAKGGSAIDAATSRPLTFSGRTSVTVAPGTLVLSDPVNLAVAPMTDVAISLYVPNDTGSPAIHRHAIRTTYVAKGNLTAAPSMPADAATFVSYFWLSSLDVVAAPEAYTIATLGDSITDGWATTVDANLAWPTLLAKRLAADKRTQHVGVVNQGISGNQLLRNGAGVSMLARFDRDILARPGVRWVVLLAGINDINFRSRAGTTTPLTPEELIAGYEQIIERCHSHGIRIVGATITPQEGQTTATAAGEAIRQAVNAWIRTSGRFDAVVDFDAAIRDPARPARMKAEFDPGDHIHPNDRGNEAMAAAFDLALFAR